MFPKIGLGVGYSSVTSGSESAPVLRFAAAGNRLNNRMPSPTPVGNALYRVGHVSRTKYAIGSDDFSEFRLLCPNFSIGISGVQTPGNDVTIVNIGFESLGLVSCIRVKFSGNNGIVLPDGDYAQLSDPIYPSDFGLTKFTRGEFYFSRVEINIPIGAASNIPMSSNHDYSNTGGSLYNADITAPTNIIGTGSITGMTGATSSAFGCWKPILLGKTASGSDFRAIIGIGDSIMAGVSNSGAPSNQGVGVFGTMLHNAGNPIAGLNCGCSGGVFQAWSSLPGGVPYTNPALLNLVQYATDVIDNYGTNNYDTGANVTNAFAAQYHGFVTSGFSNYYVHQASGSGLINMRFWRWNLAPRTNVPPTTGIDDQTVWGPKWQEQATTPWNNTDSLNDYFKANNTSSNLWHTAYTNFDFDTILRGDPTGSDTGDIHTSPRYHRWLNGNATCADGTHQNWQTWSACAAVVKSTMGL